MRHSQLGLRPTAFVGTLALIAATLMVGTAGPAQAAASGVETIDFEDGSTGTWVANDAATLTVVDGEGGNATQVLQVSDRTATHFGIQSPAGAFDAGVAYTFSADVLVPEDSDVRFIAYDEASTDVYNWVGNTPVVGGTWTTITGTFTFAEESIATAKASIEVGNTSDYLLDNLTITAADEPSDGGDNGGGACEAGVATIAEYTFDTTTDPWSARGAESIAVTDDARDGAGALLVSGRSDTWHGAQLDVSDIVTEGTYSITAYAKLPESAEAPVEVNLGMNEPAAENAYPWLGNRESVDSTEWVLIGGDYTVKADEPPAILYIESADPSVELILDTVLITQDVTCDEGPAPGTVAFATGFEDGLDGWELRDPGVAGDPVAEVSTEQAHEGVQSAKVSGRTSQGHGLRFNVTDALAQGTTYEVSAWVRFADSEAPDDVWVSLQNTRGGSTTFATLQQFTGMSNSEWVQITASFTMPATDEAYLYFETAWQGEGIAGNTSSFYVDEISAVVPEPPVVQDITPIKDTVTMPVGVAIDSRETLGAGAEMVNKHFDQVTAENAMKPEGWYNDAQEFAPSAEIDSLMDFAQENDLDLYGHVLVWHSQTPDWFFMDGDRFLTNAPEDQQVLRDRMRTHINNVAEYLADNWGEFGGGNPLNAFDVVNEVIDDSAAYEDGMRRSYWYQILGESFVDLAFEYADEAFNDTYAAESASQPVTLFINDYNTEQSGKRERYLSLIDRLISRDVPIDGVGHQFHVSLSMPVDNLELALADAQQTGLIQAVTELDVTTGVPETNAKFIDQGYYYRDAFNIFRSYADDLFSVTVWGLNDARSWRDANGGPLVFDDDYSAKPAYYGIVEGFADEAPLPDRLRTANVFAEAVAIDDAAVANPTWERLPLERIDEDSQFQLRWAPEYLTAYVEVDDSTTQSADAVELQVGDTTYMVGRDGESELQATVSEDTTGYSVVARIPLDETAAEGDTVQFDVRVTDGTTTSGWNSEGVTGTLSLVEPISFIEVPRAETAPVVDGDRDDLWDGATEVTTGKVTSGDPAATGTFSTLWRDNMLYVYAHVIDADVDLSGSDPWTQDSVEIYVDAGNVKNGSYRYDDTQIRINANNVQSFGTGDEAFQANRVESATQLVDDGYIVEIAISLLESGGVDSYQGVDFQVNDASGGARDGIVNWADPTGAGYQSTAHWGVAQLVDGSVDPGDGDGDGDGTDGPGDGTDGPGDGDGNGDGDGTDGGDTGNVPNSSELVDSTRGPITVPDTAVPGQTITVGFGSGYDGDSMTVWMFSTPEELATVTVVDGQAQVTIPTDVALGDHRIAVYDAEGELVGWDDITLVAAAGSDSLSSTGANVMWAAMIALTLVGIGGAILASRRRGAHDATGEFAA